MPDNLESLPPSLRNKPEEQQQTYLRLYKAALSRGLTKEEAETSALLSTQAILKKTNVAKQREPVKIPSHVPTVEMVEALRKESGQRLIEEEINKQVSVPSQLGEPLKQGIQRNVIAANFDNKGRLVILFDTGEKLTTRSVDIKEYVEQFISVNNSGSSSQGVLEVVAGDNVTVDNTDPQRPIVSAATVADSTHWVTLDGTPHTLNFVSVGDGEVEMELTPL